MSKFGGFLDNLVSGALNPKGDMADYRHASRLYTDDNFRLAPKTKFLYHVSFNLNEEVIKKVRPNFDKKHGLEVNMLVKTADLPKYNVTTETKNKYNRKKNLQVRLDYDPINITFHDDNMGLTTYLWESYYRYYFVDGNLGSLDAAGKPNQTSTGFMPHNTYEGKALNAFRYGFDNNSYAPFFNSIQISQMARHQYVTYTLVNPIISSFQHDTMDQSAGGETSQNTMQILYESVFYSTGAVEEGNAPVGFGTEHYDTSPSPISIAGGGAASLLGAGGVLAGGASVFSDLSSGNVGLGTLIKATNTIKNAKKLTKEGVRNEGYSVLGKSLTAATGANVSGLANSSFPKSGGTGQNNATEATPLVTSKQNKQLSNAEIQNQLEDVPILKDAVAKQLVATGVVASTVAGLSVGNAVGLSVYETLTVQEKNAIKEEVDEKIAEGDPKVLSVSNKIVSSYRESQGILSNV